MCGCRVGSVAFASIPVMRFMLGWCEFVLFDLFLHGGVSVVFIIVVYVVGVGSYEKRSCLYAWLTSLCVLRVW